MILQLRNKFEKLLLIIKCETMGTTKKLKVRTRIIGQDICECVINSNKNNEII